MKSRNQFGGTLRVALCGLLVILALVGVWVTFGAFHGPIDRVAFRTRQDASLPGAGVDSSSGARAVRTEPWSPDLEGGPAGVSFRGPVLRSVVLSAATGNPIRASVTEALTGHRAWTDQLGSFRIVSRDEGALREFEVEIQAEGFLDRRIRAPASDFPAVIRLQPRSELLVRVIGEDMLPVASAEVVLIPAESAGSTWWRTRSELPVHAMLGLGGPSKEGLDAPLAISYPTNHAGEARIPCATGGLVYAHADSRISNMERISEENGPLSLLVRSDGGQRLELFDEQLDEAIPGVRLALRSQREASFTFALQTGSNGRTELPLPRGDYEVESLDPRVNLVGQPPMVALVDGKAAIRVAGPGETLRIDARARFLGAREIVIEDAASGIGIEVCYLSEQIVSGQSVTGTTLDASRSIGPHGRHRLPLFTHNAIRQDGEPWRGRLWLSVAAPGFQSETIKDPFELFGGSAAPRIRLMKSRSMTSITVVTSEKIPFRGAIRITDPSTRMRAYEGWYDGGPVEVDSKLKTVRIDLATGLGAKESSIEVELGGRERVEIVAPARGRIIVWDVPEQWQSALGCADHENHPFTLSFDGNTLVTEPLPDGTYRVMSRAQLEATPELSRTGQNRYCITIADGETKAVHWSAIFVPEIRITGTAKFPAIVEPGVIAVAPSFSGSLRFKRPTDRILILLAATSDPFEISGMVEMPRILEFYWRSPRHPLRLVGSSLFARDGENYDVRLARVTLTGTPEDFRRMGPALNPTIHDGPPTNWRATIISDTEYDFGVVPAGSLELSFASEGTRKVKRIDLENGRTARFRMTGADLVPTDP